MAPPRQDSRPTPGAALVAAAIALVAAAPLPSARQEPPGFGETVEVEVVTVEAQVTGADGRPLAGLRVEEFELFQDGRRVEISHFAAPTPVPPPAAEPAAEPAAAPEPAAASYLVVLVDNAHLRPGDRRRVLRRVSEFLEARRETAERVMVASYDGGPHVRQGFTSDRGLVLAALAGMEKLSAQGVARDAERRHTFDTILQIFQSYGESCVPEMEQVAKAYAANQFHEVAGAVAGLRQFVDSLGGLAGRKALLYVSNGFPARSGEDALQLVAELCGEAPGGGNAFLAAQHYDASRRLATLAAAANANRVTFYALEASGLEAPVSSGAQTGDLRLMGFAIEQARVANLEDTLNLLAAETGGRAFFNRNDWQAVLGDVAADLASAYSLAFSPGHPAEGGEHRLEVRVRVPGARVRCRQSYRHKTPTERLADRTLAALLAERVDNPLAVEVSVGPPRATGRGHFVSQLRLQVPLAGLTLLPADPSGQGGSAQPRRGGRVRLLLVVRDGAGATTPVRTLDLVVQAPAGDGPAPGVFRYTIDVETGPGAQSVGLGVHDLVGASSSFLRLALDLPRG